jgi:aspartyl-tRNA(Asn)/glutamyl-tRNA(Gln) amidotransferase subunit A
MKVTDEDLWSPLSTMSSRIAQGDISPVALTEAMLARIEALEPKLNAYITVTGDLALEQAARAQREIAAGKVRGPLHGIPIALKDLVATAGIRTTFASNAYASWVPDADADITERLRSAGAVLLGKTNLSEGAADSSSVSSAFGAPHNPWHLDYITGGSSGGSAAAVAAGTAFAAIGSDTAMSIRQPAALCGIVGLKPSFGRVSKRGAMSLSFSLDHLGPMTRTVEDCAIVLSAIAGHDSRDSTSVKEAVPDYRTNLAQPVRGLRLGIVRDLFDDAPKSWQAAADNAASSLTSLGMVGHEVTLEHLHDLTQLGSVLIGVEAAAFHGPRFDEAPASFGPGLHALIQNGRSYSGAEYVQAQRIRRMLCEQTLDAMRGFDVLIFPTTTRPACRIVDDEPKLVLPRSRNTLPFNVLGVPAISLPAGLDESGMPIGVQLVGQPFAEETLLQVAHAFEQSFADDYCRPSGLKAR